MEFGCAEVWKCHLQWAKKPSHKRSNFTCEANCCSGNKGKPVGNFYNKGRYPVLCYPKVQRLSQCYCFNIYFTIGYPRWDSFFALRWFCPFCPLPLPLSFWAGSKLVFYKPSYVFSLFHLHQPPKPMHTSRRDLIMLRCHLSHCHRHSIGEVRWLCRTLQYIDLTLSQLFSSLLKGLMWAIRQLKDHQTCLTHGDQEFRLKNANAHLSICSSIYCTPMNSFLKCLEAPSHQ